MASVTGPTNNVTKAAVDVGLDDPLAPDATESAAKADAKATTLKQDHKQLGKFDQNIKDGRSSEANRELGLAGKGVASLAKNDGVAPTGTLALFQIFAAPAGEVPAGEVNPQQALQAFTEISPLLGKPQAGASNSALALDNPHWPLTPLPSQSALLGVQTMESFAAQTSGTALKELPLEAPLRTATPAKGKSAGEATAPTGKAPDPQIVARVAFVQKLAALTQQTFAAQLNPEVKQQVAQQLGKKALGVLQPFADQIPALTGALKGVFSAMTSQVDAGATDIEIPPPSLTLIEGAVGAAFGKADGFAAQVKANSAQIMPILQKMQEGDTGALQQAPAHIQDLVKGVVSWNSAKGGAAFPHNLGTSKSAATGTDIPEAGGAETAGSGTPPGGSPPVGTGVPTQAGGALSTGSSAVGLSSSATTLDQLSLSNMDINQLIFMVMSEAGQEQTGELQDAMRDMQKNTLAKQAQRQKEEALSKAKTDMKTQIDNTYYSLVALGPTNGGILPTVSMQQFEDGMSVSWGDGQSMTDSSGNPTGNWSGPTPTWQMPSPLPTAWTTPPATTTGGKTAQSGIGATSYGLDTAQYTYLADYFAALQKADPTDYGSMSLDQWLQAKTTATPKGAGLISPITSAKDAAKNIAAAGNLSKATLPNGGTNTGAVADLHKAVTDPTFVDANGVGDPQAAADIDAILLAQGIMLPGSDLDRTKALAELVTMESALYNSSDKPPAGLGDKLAADEALLQSVLTNAEQGGLGTGTPDPATQLQKFLTASPPQKGLASWMKDFTSSAASIGKQFKTLEGTTSDPTGAQTGYTGGSFTFPASGATFDVKGNTGSVSGSGTWSGDRDSDTGDLGDHDASGGASINLGPDYSLPGGASDALNQILSDIGGSTTMSGDQMAALGSAPTSLPSDLKFTPPDPKKPAVDLGTEHDAAFAVNDSSTQAFVNGLPGNLPVNANGQPYDPGGGAYQGADGKTHVLSPDQQSILAELTSGGSPSIKLGPTPDQLEQQANQQALVDQINSNHMPTQLGSTVMNQSGSLGDFNAASQKASDDLDSLGDMSTNLQMRLQMLQSQYSQIMEALSNIMKSMNQTSQTLVENLKG